MNEVIPDPTKAQVAALDRLARSLGVNAEDRELFLTDRPAWEAKIRGAGRTAQSASAGEALSLGASRASGPAPTRSRPITLEAALDTDRMCAALGVTRQDLARDRANKLQEAIAAYRRGEDLSSMQLQLIADAAATSTPTRAAVLAAAAPVASPASTSRTGTMRMVSSALDAGGTR